MLLYILVVSCTRIFVCGYVRSSLCMWFLACACACMCVIACVFMVVWFDECSRMCVVHVCDHMHICVRCLSFVACDCIRGLLVRLFVYTIVSSDTTWLFSWRIPLPAVVALLLNSKAQRTLCLVVGQRVILRETPPLKPLTLVWMALLSGSRLRRCFSRLMICPLFDHQIDHPPFPPPAVGRCGNYVTSQPSFLFSAFGSPCRMLSSNVGRWISCEEGRVGGIFFCLLVSPLVCQTLFVPWMHL